MGHTIIEKILGSHAGREVSPGDIVDINIDKIVEVDGKPKREIIDVIKDNPPKMLPGFGLELK